jgi:hypothetical protein
MRYLWGLRKIEEQRKFKARVFNIEHPFSSKFSLKNKWKNKTAYVIIGRQLCLSGLIALLDNT